MKEWFIVDTETTGIVNPIYILEIYAQKMVGMKPQGQPLHIFLNHGVEIPPEASAIHGYTKEFLDQVGINPWKAHKALAQYVQNGPICSHNLAYDWERCILPERRRLKLPLVGCRGFCTVQLFRRCLPPHENFKLEVLRKTYGIENKSHSAKGDVLTVIEILEKHALPKLREIGIETYDQIKEFSKENPIGLCRKKLGLDPLLSSKPTPDDVLSILAQSGCNQELKEKEIEIIDSWVGENIEALGIEKIPQEIEVALDTGVITESTKHEILDLMQPLLPLNEDPITNEENISQPISLNKKEGFAPATLRQLNYIKALGGSLDPKTANNLSKLEASKLIDKIKAQLSSSKKENWAIGEKLEVGENSEVPYGQKRQRRFIRRPLSRKQGGNIADKKVSKKISKDFPMVSPFDQVSP